MLVSVIVPCRNEAAHLAGFLRTVFAQRLPSGSALEVVVADGRSDDGTAECLAAWARDERRLHVIDNPQRIVSTGLNRALAAAAGEVVVRLDVHTEYAPDYLVECLAALAATGADVVGGPWRAEPGPGAGPTQQAVAAAFQSRWVAGGARSRDLNHSGWVDTVYLGCWPRSTFERFGGFDETLVRNQDDEHNLRVLRGGGRVWQSARIRSSYRPRGRLGQVFRQYLQYGYWKPFVMRKHGRAGSWRHAVPAVFVVGLAVALPLAWPVGLATPLVLLAAAYAIAVTAMTAGVAVGQRLGWAALCRVPAVIVAYHVGYGVGSLIGACDALRRRPGRAGFGTLTR